MNTHRGRANWCRVPIVLAALPLSGVGACATTSDSTVKPATGEPTSDAPVLAVASKGPLRLSQGWVNASPSTAGMHMSTGDRKTSGMSGRGRAAAYARLTNTSGTARRLVSAASPQAASVRLNSTTSSRAGSVMKPAAGATVPAHGSKTLRPDGYHLMVEGLEHRLRIGDRLQLVLTFRDGTVMNVALPVIDPTDRPDAGS